MSETNDSSETDFNSELEEKEMQTETIPNSDESSQTDESKTEQKLEILKELCTKCVEKLESHSEIMKQQASRIEILEKAKAALAERVETLETRNSRLKALVNETF